MKCASFYDVGLMYELGILFAVLSTMALGSNKLAVRKTLFHLDESFATFVSILLTIPVFGIPLLIFGLGTEPLTVQVLLIFALTGITNYTIGRYFIWKSIANIGANRGNILAASQVVYAVVIAIVVLRQSIDVISGLGVLLVLLGIVIISYGGNSERNFTPKQVRTGLIYGLIGGLAWGISQDLMQIGIRAYTNAIAASFFTYFFSLIGVVPALVIARNQSEKKDIFRMNTNGLILVIIAGLLGSAGQYFRYLALKIIPVTIVATINGTNPAVTLILSFLLIKDVEYIDSKTILGIVVSILGVILVSY